MTTLRFAETGEARELREVMRLAALDLAPGEVDDADESTLVVPDRVVLVLGTRAAAWLGAPVEDQYGVDRG